MRNRRLILFIAIFVSGLFVASASYFIYSRCHTRGIKILGHYYSPKLRELYDNVIHIHKKPIRIIERKTKGDDNISTNGDIIELKINRGCSEDNIAHELMHAILHSEGYTCFWGVKVLPLSMKIDKVIGADLDHLIINDRLQQIGYNPFVGFLSEAESYEKFLLLDIPQKPNAKAIHLFLFIHELLKHHYYIADPNAEDDILKKCPDIRLHWDALSNNIDSLSENPTVFDIWKIGTQYISIGDAICDEYSTPFHISDLIGLGPIPLKRSLLAKKAASYFAHSIQPIDKDKSFLRLFLSDPKVMVHCMVIPADKRFPASLYNATIENYLSFWKLDYIIIE